MSKKPNVIMIVADEWRADMIGYTGCTEARTPNLDQLAADGVSFSNAFCQNPVCVPSRCSFLTGFYPHTKGFRTMHNLMHADQPNLLKTMKNQGYQVFWGGRNDFLNIKEDPYECCDIRFMEGNRYLKAYKTLNPEERDAPFYDWRKEDLDSRGEKDDPWYYSMYKGEKEQPGSMDQVTLEGCAEFLQNRKEEKPFFAYLSLFLPHPPYIVEPKYYDQIDDEHMRPPIRLTKEELERKPSIFQGIHRNQHIDQLTDEELKEIRRVYLAMGTKLDDYIGDLIRSLKKMGLYDDTLIIFMSDHGDYTGDYELVEKNQNTFEDCLVRVPLIIKPPEDMNVKKRRTDAMVELIDVQATIMDLTDGTYSYTQFGKSLKPVLEGSDVHRNEVFCEGGRLKEEGWYAMDAGHKESNEYWPRTSEQESMPQHTKAVMIRNDRYKYVKRLYEEDEFYDLTKDPYECHNIIRTCDKDLLQSMRNRLLEFYMETSDVVPHTYDKRS